MYIFTSLSNNPLSYKFFPLKIKKASSYLDAFLYLNNNFIY